VTSRAQQSRLFHSIPLSVPLIRSILESQGACAYLRHHRASRQNTPWMECQPIAGHTHTQSFTHAITHYEQFRDSNQPRSMSLDCGRKPEYPEKTHQVQGEHANSTHTLYTESQQ
ncbi:hypothetical protein QTP70_031815, partial [Hemibagrus guttatus]